MIDATNFAENALVTYSGWLYKLWHVIDNNIRQWLCALATSSCSEYTDGVLVCVCVWVCVCVCMRMCVCGQVVRAASLKPSCCSMHSDFFVVVVIFLIKGDV